MPPSALKVISPPPALAAPGGRLLTGVQATSFKNVRCSTLEAILSICGVAGGSGIAFSAPQCCHPCQRLRDGRRQLQPGALYLTLSHPRTLYLDLPVQERRQAR